MFFTVWDGPCYMVLGRITGSVSSLFVSFDVLVGAPHVTVEGAAGSKGGRAILTFVGFFPLVDVHVLPFYRHDFCAV